ncbi:hypothetical protein [Roseibacillus persicicus]|uniref:hypothetical protein n=1 Tax=Roseibacillus persicicus TaxID=454148 RepID=UPI00280D96AF|nr:hypothetical protein [Roseibacillus persicicus]MDQ8190489.1 hypothetical protein [Roseibacillus persicicus]
MFFRILLFLTACTLYLHAEKPNEMEEALSHLHENHAQLKSYIARYDVQAKLGKKMRLTLATHRDEGLNAVVMEFQPNEADEDSLKMLQLFSPEVGLITGSSTEALHYSDLPLVFNKLKELLSQMGDSSETNSSLWVPGFQLGESDINSNMLISSKEKFSWIAADSDLSEGTLLSQDEDSFTFQTSDKVIYRVDAKSGLLLKQTFTTIENRKLELSELKLNPSREEVQAVIAENHPKKLEVQHFAQSPLFLKLNLYFAAALIAAVDKGEVSPTEFQKFLTDSRTALGDYLSLALPDCHSIILPEEKWAGLFDGIISVARKKFEEQDADDPLRLEWKTIRAMMLLEHREKIETTLLKSFSEGFKLDDVLTEEQLDADTVDGFTAMEMLFAEVKRAMVYSAVKSAIKKYWDEAE